jgi:hypothetical protein
MHNVIVCNEQSNRLAVVEVIGPCRDWVAELKDAAVKYMAGHDLPFLQWHVSNGDLIVWVGGGSRCWRA